MSSTQMLIVFATMAVAIALPPAARAAIAHIAASDSELHFTLSGDPADGEWAIVEIAPLDDYAAGFPSLPREVWRGDATASVTAPRFDGPRDGLFGRYQLRDAKTDAPLGAPRFVTDLAAMTARDDAIAWPESKKGLTCITDIEDAIATGTDYADEGVPIGLLIDWSNERPDTTIDVDGHAVPINMGFVGTWMDPRYKQMTDGGMNFTPVPINQVPTEAQPGNPLIHPKTDLANTPMHHGAFNLTSEEGLRCFRAMIEFIAERYTRPDGAFGRISGMVIGNEVQSHWVWHNMGEVTVEEMTREYTLMLRIADLAARKYHKGLRTYASLEHHWTKRGFSDDPLREARGKDVLELLNQYAKAEGDFPWHLAHHPYPENLFEPRFWRDKTATHRYDTPRITFKNLEVLAMFMKRPEMCYQGTPRHIMLTEQGFHTPDTPDGEAVQAAAFAYAYHKVKHMPEIDAFIMHRHTSMRDEGGLDLGLWRYDRDDPSGAKKGEKKRIWEVYKAAGTPAWEEAFAFAMPIIGIDSWDEALPDYTIDTRPAPEVPADALVYDFVSHLRDAKREGFEVEAALRMEMVVRAAGWLAKALFHHPPTEGVSDATFEVALPKTDGERRLLMRFDTMFAAETANGTRFAVLVDGDEVWHTVQSDEEPVSHEIDLTPWAGRTVAVTLRMDALGDTSYDWAQWVQPVVVIE